MNEQREGEQSAAGACPVCRDRKEAEVNLDDVQFFVACPCCNNGDPQEWELLCGPLESAVE
jgi:hypothetical protein